MEMEYAIRENGEIIGNATVRREGLYWRICAEVTLRPGRIVRLYAHEAEKTVRLGIPAPEGGSFRLEKRLAVRGFVFTPQTRIDTDEAAVQTSDAPEDGDEAPWEPFSGHVLEYPAVGRIRRHAHGATLAVECAPGEEFPLTPLFCFCRMEEAEGKLRWLIELDEAGAPVMPQEKKPLTSEENVLE